MLAFALTAVVGTTAYAQVRLNAWNQPFYIALAHKDFPVFIEQLGVFAGFAGLLLVLNVAQRWLNQTSKVVLREGLVDSLMTQWLSPARAFRLSNAGEIGANPDQRIQQDAQHLTELTTDLGIGLLQSTLLLLSFVGVLWLLSSNMVFSFDSYTFAPPGYMVWCALIYASAASFLSWRVGRPLINLNAERYAREAEFRFALVRVNEDIGGMTPYRGESDKRVRLDAVFGDVLDISRRIVGAVTRLTWITAGYGWFSIVAPILVSAPAYFRSEMSFGELMMIAGAFNQVQQALGWFVDNFSNIADWRATLLRVASFRKAIVTMDELGQTASRIHFAETDDPSIRIDDLHVASPVGCVMLSEPHTDLEPGERIPLVPSERGLALLAQHKEQNAAKQPGRLTYVAFRRRISRQREGNQLSSAASSKPTTPLSTPLAKLGENSSRSPRQSHLSAPGPAHTSVKTYDRWYYSSPRRQSRKHSVKSK